MGRSTTVVRSLAALLMALFACAAHGYCNAGFSSSPVLVSENYDAATDRYFQSWTVTLLTGLACGWTYSVAENAPPISTATGLVFYTWAFGQECVDRNECKNSSLRSTDLCRFRAERQSEPASRFFTLDEEECASLKQPGSGWVFEPFNNGFTGGIPSLGAAKVDPSSGNCPAGLMPVYRFYNNRWREGLSNHRYVADEAVRKQMRDRPGWSEERIAFCVIGSGRSQIAYVSQQMYYGGGTVPTPDCVRSDPFGSACIEGDNVQTPVVQRGPYSYSGSLFGTQSVAPLEYYDRTGAITPYVFTSGNTSDTDQATHTFYQKDAYWFAGGNGFYLTSADRTAGSTAAIRARTLSQYSTVRPFLSSYEVDMDLIVSFRIFVKRTRASGTLSGAAARPLIALRDAASGRRFFLSPGAVGTFAVTDTTIREELSGEIVASIALSPTPTVGRNFGLPTLQVPGDFDSPSAWGYGGNFEYRINRKEFARVLERVRFLDPQFNANPDSYSVESITMRGEVAGNAEIGFNVQQFSATVVRP